MAVDTHQRLDDEGGEAQVLLWGLARRMQQHAVVGGETPVVVLTTAVDACEGLLMEQYAETVLTGHALHQRHEHHVMVDSQIRLLKDRCQLKLVRSHLVVACLAGHTQFQGLDLQVAHKGSHALRNRAEVMVVHLLVLGRVVAHKGTARE